MVEGRLRVDEVAAIGHDPALDRDPGPLLVAGWQQIDVTPRTGQTNFNARAYWPSITDRSSSTIPVTGMKLLPRLSSTPGDIGSIISGIVTSMIGIK